jgi:alkylation response protein AidB-like acyl-CoA dehydrogenase
MIDFTLSDTQKQQRDAAKAYASKVLSGAHAVYSKETAQKDRFRSVQPFYHMAVAGGQLAGLVPVPLGGTCVSLLDAAIMLEELYATDPSVTLTVASTGLGLMPLMFSNNEELQKRFLPLFLKGEGEPLASLVHSEPGGTANWLEKGAQGLGTTARKEGDSWVINGEKVWTTNSGGWDGKGADLQCVVCREVKDAANGTSGVHEDSNDDPAKSIIILMVTRDIVASNDGSAYEILGEPELMGHPATSGPHSRFTNFKVPAENVLAAGEAAAGLVEQAFTATAALVGAFSVSIMRAAYEAGLEFAKTDTRGGTVPILQRQSVANLLIDVKCRIDSCRLLTWKALHCLENGPGDFKARQELCLETKIYASDNAVKSVTDVMSAVGM